MKFAWRPTISIFIVVFFTFNNNIFAFNTFHLTFPFGEAYIDPAGYSDEIDWGWSDYHPHNSHELLSGE